MSRAPITKSSEIMLSPSCINTFNICPRMFEAKYVTFTAPYESNPAMELGNKIHAAIENTLKHGVELDPVAEFTRPCVDWVLDYASRPGVEMSVERGMAVTKDLKPIDWKGRWNEKPWLRAKADVNIIDSTNGVNVNIDWKGLALDTLIPTPDGWSTMGELEEGDALFDIDGSVCYVVGKSRVKTIRCFKLTFSNGEEIICDEEHLWITDKGVMNIKDMQYEEDESARIIPAAGELDTPEFNFQVSPYVFGMWLGAGKRFSEELVVSPAREIAEALFDSTINYNVTAQSHDAQTISIVGLRRALRQMQQLGVKRVPVSYLRGSYRQRIWLLRGIMAVAGGVDEATGRLYADFPDGRLANDFVELLRTLGRQGHITSRVVTTPAQGAVYGTRVYFSVLSYSAAFLYGKEAGAERRINGSWDARSHYIESIEEVEPVPTQCIKVDSPSSSFLCGKGYIPTHNTGKLKQDVIQEHALGLCASVNSGLPRTINHWVFLKEGKTITNVLDVRKPDAVADIHEAAEKIHTAIDTQVFQPKYMRNGLCKAHCPVMSCPHNGRRK